MEDAHPESIAMTSQTTRDLVRLHRQRRFFWVLACLIPAASLTAVAISVWRAW